MPALPPTPSGVVRFRLIHELDSDLSIGCHFDYSYTGGPPSNADLATLAAGVAGAWNTDLASLLSSDGLLSSVIAIDLANPSTVEGVWTGSHAGTRSGNIATLATAACFIWAPNRRYRGSRPKMFTPYGVQADVTGANEWTSGFQSAAVTAMDAFLGALSGLSAGSTNLTSQAYVSFFEGFTVTTSPTTGRSRNTPKLRTVPAVFAVSTRHLQARLGSQRRRLSSGG